MPRYTGPIVDAHHHFWQPSLNRQPWLEPGVDIGFRYGPYETIKRDYLPPDLLEDAEPLNVVGTVTMETEWRLDDPVGEMLYMQKMHDTYGLPDAAVAHAVLADPKVHETLERLAEIPVVRSVRNKPGQSISFESARSNDTLLTDAQWISGFKRLKAVGLSFDLQVAWWHFDDAFQLFKAHSDIPVIINHAGLPADRSREALKNWRDAVQLIAQLPNVVMKISGIGVQGVPWTVENNRYIVESLFEAFGPDRVMFASNFPVDGLCATYREIYDGFLEISSTWSPSEQRKAFIGNAIRIYSLPEEVGRRMSPPSKAFERHW